MTNILKELIQQTIREEIKSLLVSELKTQVTTSTKTKSKPKRNESQKEFSDNAVRLFNAHKIRNSHKKNAQEWTLISEHSNGGKITLKPYCKGYVDSKPQLEDKKTFDTTVAGIVIEINHKQRKYINQIYVTRVEYGKKKIRVVTFEQG